MREGKRLRAIADLLDNQKRVVADIGADHGFLTAMLIKEGKADQIIATDISEQSLSKAKRLVKELGFANKVSFKVGDGLDPIKSDKIDVVVIAGMGGYEIIKILKESTAKFSRYILQPMQNPVQLRKFLIENHFLIIKDFIVKDKDKFYSTLEVVVSDKLQHLTLEELELGLTNFDLKTKEFLEYLIKQKIKYKKIIDKIEDQEAKEKLEMIERLIEKLY